MAWRFLITQVTRHQSEVGKVKTLLDTRNRLCCSQERFQSSFIRSLSRGLLGGAHIITGEVVQQNDPDPEAVIREFESRPSLHAKVLSQYVNALVKLDRLDQSQFLLDTFQRGLSMNEKVQLVESKTTFKDVIGAYCPKKELKEIVEYLRDPEEFVRLGARLRKCYLLAGPDGTGKTMLVRAVAGEAGVPFFSCNGREFETCLGDGARRMSNLFAASKKRSRSIIFIDEIDQIYTRRTFDQLLVELDGLKQNDCVFVIAATDDPDSLHTSLVKNGRFDRRLDVLKPDEKERLLILESLMPEEARAEGGGFLSNIAYMTRLYSGADLANMVNLAALEAARNGAKYVTFLHIRFAIAEITKAKGYQIAYQAKGRKGKKVSCWT